MRHTIFRRLTAFDKVLVGRTVSELGSGFSSFALLTIAVVMLHVDSSQVGILVAAGALPYAMFGLFAGAIVDRYPRRTVMICADVVCCATVAIIALVVARGALNVVILYAGVFTIHLATLFFGVAYRSYLGMIVSADELASANAKLSVATSGASMLGSALAGILMRIIGAAMTIAVDAISYAVSLLAIVSVPARGVPEPEPGPGPRTLLSAMFSGFRVFSDESGLRTIVAAALVATLGGSVAGSVLFNYVYDVLHLQPAPFAVVSGLAELGFFGALLSVPVCKIIGLRLTMVASLLLLACGIALELLAQFGLPYVVIFLGSAIQAVCMPVLNVNVVTYVQRAVDNRLHGRVFAAVQTVMALAVPLGALVGGYVGRLLGVSTTIAFGATVVALSACIIVVLPRLDASNVTGRALSAPQLSVEEAHL
jgi:predicted MFS family arabinose efflux permease